MLRIRRADEIVAFYAHNNARQYDAKTEEQFLHKRSSCLLSMALNLIFLFLLILFSTGADLSALVREASLNAIRINIKHKWNEIMPDENKEQPIIKVTCDNFNDAFAKVCPSISKTVSV